MHPAGYHEARLSLTAMITGALAIGAAAQLACSGGQRPASTSGAPVAVAPPPRESRDPRPAIPVIEERDASTDASGSLSVRLPVSDVEQVVASLRARFRACYQVGLGDDPKMQGRVLLSVKVSPEGNVVAVTSVRREGLSARVVTCMADVVRGAQFSPPGARGTTLQVPLTFKH